MADRLISTPSTQPEDQTRQRLKKAFTLIELLVVIAIKTAFFRLFDLPLSN